MLKSGKFNVQIVNARLIAAAPELLEALQMMVDKFAWGGQESEPECIKASEAIKKAIG